MAARFLDPTVATARVAFVSPFPKTPWVFGVLATPGERPPTSSLQMATAQAAMVSKITTRLRPCILFLVIEVLNLLLDFVLGAVAAHLVLFHVCIVFS